MRRVLIILAILGFIIGLQGESGFSAVITLTNGKTLKGKILEEDEDTIQIQVGEIPIPLFKEYIVSVEDDDGNIRYFQKETPEAQEPVVSTPIEEPPGESKISPRPTAGKQDDDDEPRPAVPAPRREPGDVEEAKPLLPLIVPQGTTVQVIPAVLNVREGPSTDYKKIGALNQDTILVQIDKQDSWLRVRLPDGSYGWVYGYHVEEMQDEPVICTGQKVNFRKNPGTNYRVIKSLRYQEVLLLLRERGDWCQLRDAEGNIGWAHSNYIAKPPSPLALQTRYAKVTPAAAGDEVTHVSRLLEDTLAFDVQLTLTNPDWLSGGKVSLVLLAPKVEPERWDLLVQGKDIVEKTSFHGSDAVSALGIESIIGNEFRASQRVVIKGYPEDGAWVFNYRITEPQLTGLQKYLVGQSADRRGKFYKLD